MNQGKKRELTGRELFLSIVPSGKPEYSMLTPSQATDPDIIKRVISDAENCLPEAGDIIRILLAKLAKTENQLCAAHSQMADNPL